MKEETIRMLCEKHNMGNAGLFVRFFTKRFPNENDRIHSYCEEWIERFLSGNPVCYMDNESREKYIEAIKEV